MLRILAALGVAMMLAGCATSATNTLSQQARDALRIDAVDVDMAKADISWPTEKEEFVRNHPQWSPTAASLDNHLRQKAEARIKAALDAEIPRAFRGTELAKLKVVVHSVVVPHPVQRILIGGHHIIVASIYLTDARSGKILLQVERFTGQNGNQGGVAAVLLDQLFPDPIDRVASAFASALRRWLQTGEAFATG